MSYKSSADSGHVACVGTGLMGSGWAAHFLRAGRDVVAYDPNPAAATYVRDTVKRAWPVVEALGLSEGASLDRLRITDDLAEAVQGAVFIQESAPEDEALKIELLAQIDGLASPDTVICSSSSGFLAGRLRSACKHKGRVLVGHPFNPPYLIPLVEVVAGDGADADAVSAAVAFYESVNGKAIVLKKDILGYVANRLQMALFREIFHLVSEDVASVADIDDAIAYGPGLRWAVFGPCQIFKLASQTPEQYGDFIDLLAGEIDAGCVAIDEPTIKPGVKEKLIEGVMQAAGTRSYDALVEERDTKIIAVRKALGV
jgi:carnitine 3-dehydrogenase